MSAAPFPAGSLAALPRWVGWRQEKRQGRPPTKVPYIPDPGHEIRASSTKPADWGMHDSAAAWAERHVNGDAGGCGIVLGELQDGRMLAGADLDRCLDIEAGAITPWAQEVIEHFGTYTEVSPSGTGLKLLFWLNPADIEPARAIVENKHKFTLPGHEMGAHPPAIEIYLEARYFAVTWQQWNDAPDCLRTVSLADLRWLVEEAGPALAGKARRRSSPGQGAAAGRGADADNSLLARVRRACAGDQRLRRRWDGDREGMSDQSRSALAFAIGGALKAKGFSQADVFEALRGNAHTAEWATNATPRELDRVWARASEGDDDRAADADADAADRLANPDMGVLRLHRRPPPELPLHVFGAPWRAWIEQAAEAGACPADYVVGPLLAAASALIGNARWAQGAPGWVEPPHLWIGCVGDSGNGKSPGSDALHREVLPVIETRMGAGFLDQQREWKAAAEARLAAEETWKAEVRIARKSNNAPPLPPASTGATHEPVMPRLRQYDVTLERVGVLLAHAAPKGVIIVRDELSGWLSGMTVYNEAGRAFWIEAYGGRRYTIERQKNAEPIIIEHNVVAVSGGTQPDKLAELMQQADDGLLGRFLWMWPDARPFDLTQTTPNTTWATDALDRLRLLELTPQPNGPAKPVMVPLAAAALVELRTFGREMQQHQSEAGGLWRSGLGKARGHALRLAIVVEHLWWCSRPGWAAPPTAISVEAFRAAVALMHDYFIPMGERSYGDAAITKPDRNAATLARWIVKTQAATVHVRHIQREVRLPGLGNADDIHAAAQALVEAGWLLPPAKAGRREGRAVQAYTVNAIVLGGIA